MPIYSLTLDLEHPGGASTLKFDFPDQGSCDLAAQQIRQWIRNPPITMTRIDNLTMGPDQSVSRRTEFHCIPARMTSISFGTRVRYPLNKDVMRQLIVDINNHSAQFYDVPGA